MLLSPFVVFKAFKFASVYTTLPTVNVFNGRIPGICIYLSQERLTHSWITACFIGTTPKYYILLPSLSVLAAVLLRSSVVGHAMLSRHLILAVRGILLGKEKKKKQTKK